MPKTTPTEPQSTLLLTLAQSLHHLHSIKSSIPSSSPLLTSPSLEDPDTAIKQILETYWPKFTNTFSLEQGTSIWIGFNSALLWVWDMGDIDGAEEKYWDAVGEVFCGMMEMKARVVDGRVDQKPECHESIER